MVTDNRPFQRVAGKYDACAVAFGLERASASMMNLIDGITEEFRHGFTFVVNKASRPKGLFASCPVWWPVRSKVEPIYCPRTSQ
ncbi:hypothetical protein DEM27_01535 [Metarhizobium album]|uniref:Uncharacterized protein n=1 Tax=Metarhizobium album TaxID=2182425 RepID=A0A2U2DXG1_9HYPH|nr:hypothetical protein DEM27_01535 [Rhizobium album]